MARAALSWTLKDVEERTGVNKNTISRYEAGAAIMSDTLQKLERVFKAEGVQFLEEDEQFGPGVRLRRETGSEARIGSKTANERTKSKKSRKRMG
jgi:transcriptional regulator with XRE-family HTH domain